jgi:hypothetical protein
MKKGRTVADAAFPWTLHARLKAHELAEQGIETLALAGVTIESDRSHDVRCRRRSLSAKRPRLKRVSGSLQWQSAVQAEPRRTRDTMLNGHLL